MNSFSTPAHHKITDYRLDNFVSNNRHLRENTGMKRQRQLRLFSEVTWVRFGEQSELLKGQSGQENAKRETSREMALDISKINDQNYLIPSSVDFW